MDRDVLTTLKLLIIGEAGVGKSTMLLRFVEDEFKEDLRATIGTDYKSKQIKVDGNIVKLAIWDTAGTELYRTLMPNYYRDGQGAILMFDVTNRHSFTKLESWLNELNNYCNKIDIVKMVVGNKIDLPDREVSKEEGLEFAQRHNTLYIESSAKTADGVECCFEELVQKIIQTQGLWEANSMMYSSDSSGGTRNRLGKKGIRLTDDYEPQNPHSSCYCSLV